MIQWQAARHGLRNRLPRHRHHDLPRRSVVVRGLASLLMSVLAGLGCASDTTGPALVAAGQLYQQLTLNHHAITLALTSPYDTLQLIATPYAASGAVLPDSSATTWTTSDSSSVRVSATGLLTARTVATQVLVIASRTIGRVTQHDSTLVNVTDTTTIPRFARLALSFPDTAPLNGGLQSQAKENQLFGVYLGLPAALDPQGDTIPNVLIRVVSTDPIVLQNNFAFGLIASYYIAGGDAIAFLRGVAGHTQIIAEATVYGVRRVDTLAMTVGWWQNGVVTVLPRYSGGSTIPIGTFSPSVDTIAMGGTVAWVNVLPGLPIDVVFDDSTAVQAVDSATYFFGRACFLRVCIPTQGGGNIPRFAPVDTGVLRGNDTLGVRARRFPIAGTYHYHSVLYGKAGSIVVLPESSVP